MNILEALEKGVEASIKRDSEKFAKEHARYGFWGNPFSDSHIPMTSGFEKLFVNRNIERNELVEIMVAGFLGNGDDIAIISPKGFGGRSLINLFNNFIHSLNKENISPILKKLKEKLGELIEFDAHSITDQQILELRGKIENSLSSQKILMITSSFNSGITLAEGPDENLSNVEKFRKLLEMDERSKERAFFLSPWNASSWNYMCEKHPLPVGIYENAFILKPLKSEEIVELLNLRMAFSNCDVEGIKIFNQENLKHIAKYSGGIPGFALRFASILVEDAIKTEREKPFEPREIDKILKNNDYMSYLDIKKKFEEIIPTKKESWQKEKPEKLILKNMIYLSGNDVTSTEVAKLIGKTKNAVTKTMNKMKDMGLIEKPDVSEHLPQADRRRVPFRINDFVISVFENEHIIPEIETSLKSSQKLYKA